MKRMGYYRDIT